MEYAKMEAIKSNAHIRTFLAIPLILVICGKKITCEKMT
jgi:hypothetical protein